MGDPVMMTVVGVGAALTKVFLRACDAALAADVVADVQELLGALSRASHRSDGSRDQIELSVRKALAARLQEMHKHRYSRDIDRQLLSGACTEVEIILNEIADDGELILSAALNPDSLPAVFHSRASQRRLNIEEAAEPYFDELIEAVATQYAALAPWSTRFQIEAFKSILSGIDEIQENSRRSLDAHAVTQDKIDTLSSKFDEVVRHENMLSRVFFGSRPDVVVENRFVERSEQEHLNALIADPTRRRTVLVGMRGCGKTQLASALAQQCEDAHWSLVAWVNASSTESITSDLVELARELKIDTSDQPAPEFIIPRLFTRLNSADPSDRLIVFDNVENIDDLPAPVPRCKGLRVVATTTNKAGWEDQGWNSVKVGVFDRVRSIDYLLTVTKSDDHDTADALAERLGDLPLAIAQAAATARNRDLSLTRYMDRLDSYRSERVIRPVPGGYYADDVATALCMAIEDALENLEDGVKQAAHYLLGALALLAESGVPTRWLDPTVEQLDDRELQGAHQADDEDAHDALTELIHRSIVQQSADKATTMLHRLQARAFRESWNEDEYAHARKTAVNLLGAVDIDTFKRTDTESRRREARSLIEQLYAIGNQKHSFNLRTNEQVTSVLSQTLTHARDLGLVLESVTLEKFAKEIEHVLGPNDLRLLNVQEELAYMIMHAGRSSEAINMYEHILDARTKMQGSDHRDTLTTQQNLAYAYYYQGVEYDKAIKLLEHVHSTRQQLLGDDDVDTLMAGSYLALVYHADGRLQEAMSRYKQVIADRTRLMGADHEHTLVTRNNLAYAYALQGLLPKAIDQYEQVLSARTRKLGALDRQTLMTRSDLALAYALNGELAEAVGRYESVLKDCTNTLGTQHPLTVDVRENLEAARRELAEQEETSHTEERSQED
jgi:hypothetical protein avisC_02045